VVTHIARNADGIAGMFEAAAHGRVADQYPGGLEQRAADIEAGAARPAAALRDDVRATCERLEQAWAATPDAAWASGTGRTSRGEMTLPQIVFRRWREVEVHHADLGLGFGWQDWSDAYVDLELDEAALGLAARLPGEMSVRLQPTDAVGCWIVETVPQERVELRAPRHELLAWLLGRHPRPDWPALGPW
jgi:maleylpyruvate isomerase